jgi:ribose-phosphate pyrophosphokinase
MMIFAPSHTAELARSIARCLDTDLAPSEEREFDGGEHKMRPLVDVRGQDVFVVQSMCGDTRASANDKLCRMLFFAGALKDAGAARVTACVPYLAYARKDRRTQSYDPITTRYVAGMFEAVGVDRVVVLDVHNEAAFDNAFRCETVRLEAVETFSDAVAASAGSRLVVASPDTGGIKRAQRLRDALARTMQHDIGYAFMEKRRAKGIVSGAAFVGDVDGSEVVIFDDLIASGTTILRATHAAREAGAKRVVVAATHAAFVGSAMQLFAADGPECVLVSDSVTPPPEFSAIPPNRLRVCSVAALFARAFKQLSCEQ